MGAPAIEVRDYDLGGEDLEAYYTTHPRALLAVDQDLRQDRRRMWEMVGHGLTMKPGVPLQRLLLYRAELPLRPTDPYALNALRLVMWAMEPGWVAAVEEARRAADNLCVVAALAGVPLEVALAVCLPVRPDSAKAP